MSKATEKVLKAMSMFGGVQAVSIACSVIRAKLIAIWIGPVGVGLFGIFNSALDMVSSTTQLNLRQSSVREISQASGTGLSRIASIVRWWFLRLGLLGSLSMLFLSPLLSMISFHDASYCWAFAMLSLAIFALSITAGEQSLMQGAGQLKRLARSTVCGVIIGTALSAPMYYFWGEGSIIPSLLVFAIAGMISTLLMQNIKGTPAVTRSEKMDQGKQFLRLGAYLTISSLATTMASYVFLSYLNSVADAAEVGFFQAGNTLVVKYVGLVFTAIAMEYYPRLSRLSGRRHAMSAAVSHEMCVLLSVLVPVLVIFVAFDAVAIRLLYADEFLVALPLVTIGVGGAVFRAVSYCMTYVILAQGDGKTYVATEVASAAIGLVLNIAFYNLWGLTGLGISYVAWYIAYVAIVGTVYRWRYRMTLSRRSLVYAASSIVITAAAIALKLWLA